MKITKTQLKQIIKEEIHIALSEAADPQSFAGTLGDMDDEAEIGGEVPGAKEEQFAKLVNALEDSVTDPDTVTGPALKKLMDQFIPEPYDLLSPADFQNAALQAGIIYHDAYEDYMRSLDSDYAYDQDLKKMAHEALKKNFERDSGEEFGYPTYIYFKNNDQEGLSMLKSRGIHRIPRLQDARLKAHPEIKETFEQMKRKRKNPIIVVPGSAPLNPEEDPYFGLDDARTQPNWAKNRERKAKVVSAYDVINNAIEIEAEKIRRSADVDSAVPSLQKQVAEIIKQELAKLLKERTK